MNEALERLRAADPLPQGCAAPPVAELRALLESAGRVHDPRRRASIRPVPSPDRRRRRFRLLAVSVAVVALSAVAFVAFGQGGGRLSLISRAYAATDPAGGVLHYSWTSRLVPAGGAPARYVLYHDEVWRSATRSRTVGQAIVVYRDGRLEGIRTERVTELTPRGERFAYYNGRTGQVSRGIEPRRRLAPPLACTALPACAFSIEDPVSALRRLYPSLRQSGGVGRGELTSGGRNPIGVVVYLDPHTGDPLRVITRFAPGQPTTVSTTVFRDYSRLPLDAATEADLRFAAHQAKHRS